MRQLNVSVKSDGPSLNECLYKGPCFNQLILDLLLRFRCYRVTLTADVEKAFLMISVADNDRDVLRFIWVDDVDKERPELRVYKSPELSSEFRQVHFYSIQQLSTTWSDTWNPEG